MVKRFDRDALDRIDINRYALGVNYELAEIRNGYVYRGYNRTVRRYLLFWI